MCLDEVRGGYVSLSKIMYRYVRLVRMGVFG